MTPGCDRRPRDDGAPGPGHSAQGPGAPRQYVDQTPSTWLNSYRLVPRQYVDQTPSTWLNSYRLVPRQYV
ncbi:hypothetical protein, partial [Brachybacterium sp. SW0106-09]|uniref:hypothetical protein n=1 Tax=Brachybacterium sp. SW0106-09 TaxID=1704590 RepID=UPI001F16FE44